MSDIKVAGTVCLYVMQLLFLNGGYTQNVFGTDRQTLTSSFHSSRA